MRGKRFFWTLLILMLLASMAKVSIPATSSPAVTFKVDPPITSGVPVGPYGVVAVNVSIEADPGTAVVGWGLSIKVDPNVLKPGFTYEGEEYIVWTGTPGYFLYDWCVANNWDPQPGTLPTMYIIGSKNETTGTINGTTEYIKKWADLGVGNGSDGTGNLATFFFTSKNETAWSPIEITEAFYFTSWKYPDMDPHVPDIIINGHYNEPPIIGSIAGEVTDETGWKIIGATVEAVGFETKSTTTGAEGTYSLTDLVPGVYMVTASKSGYGYEDVTKQVTVEANKTTTCDFALPTAVVVVHNINTTLNYSTIQGAIDAPETLDGHTIFVEAGTYYEHVVVSKNVSLVGENRSNTIIDGNSTGIVIVVIASDVEITGFTIQNSGFTHPGSGIYIGEWSNGNNISYNLITNNYNGILLSGSSNNSISGNNITNNWRGIVLYQSSDNTVSGNNLEANNYDGIEVLYSSNNSISGNNVINNSGYGISLDGSPNNILRDNSMANNTYSFGVGGKTLLDFVDDVDASNTVDGKPIYYLIKVRDMAVPLDAGYVALVNCANITVQNLNLTNNWQGVLLAFTTSSTITKNNITNNNEYGIWLYRSSNNSISGNNITNNWRGIVLYQSSDNTVSGNNITNNEYGIRLYWSSNNKFYHNNLIDNTQQVYIYSSGYANFWDDGYPSGGNYWSDYTDVDLYSGPNQDVPGSDGIWDHPYTIDANNQDRYPLVEPWTPPAIKATVDVDPNALNLCSKGEWVTAYIELPEGYNVSEIDIYSIKLNNTFPVSLLVVPPVPVPTEIGDYDDDDIPDLMVKFNMTELTSYICLQGIKYGNVTLTISGNLTDGTQFEGEDTVKVLLPGDLDHDGDVDWSDFNLFCASYPTFPPEVPIVLGTDLEGDGDIDGDDFILFCGYYGKKL